MKIDKIYIFIVNTIILTLLIYLTIRKPRDSYTALESTVITTTEVLNNWELLQLAIIKTESDFNNTAIGSSKDLGIFQITPIFVEEINRILDEDRYIHEDSFIPSKSIEMFNIMQDTYNPTRDIIKAIKIHNPGGNNIDYSKKVLKNLEYIKQYETIRNLIIENDKRRIKQDSLKQD